ncbi:MAG: methyltransferase domain-containing protein [Bacteroidota bacterium]
MSNPIKLHPPLVKGVITSLREIFQENRYADKVIQFQLKSNPKWGSRDRAFIAENVYEIVRWWRLLRKIDARRWENNGQGSDDDFTRILGINLILKGFKLPAWEAFKDLHPKSIFLKKEKLQNERKIAQSIPDWLDELGERELGNNWDEEINALNKMADVVLRTNTLNTNKYQLKKMLQKSGWETTSSPTAPNALMLKKRGNVFSSPFFKKGLFEVQDAGSQQIAPYLMVEPGMRVIDACAGAGGKTLHLAALMENKGQIIALDTAEWKLKELKRRAKRNGIHIIETRTIKSSKVVKRLAESADRLLLDVPCSGLGVLRRNPDAKWKLSPEFIERLKNTQADILQRYSQMLKPDGLMVYATCSILPSENEQQVGRFLENNKEFELMAELTISPAKYNCDGFYMARLKRGH